MTRGSVFLAAVLLAASLGATAQNNEASGPQSNSDNNAQRTVTISGCLNSSGAGAYTLSDAQGNTYTLTGNTETLQGHAGQEIEVSGQKAFPSRDSSATSSSGNSGPSTIDVTNAEFVADHCEGAGSPQPGSSGPGATSAPHDLARPAATNRSGTTFQGAAQQSEVPAGGPNGQLPQTSTILPLLGLIGLGSLVAGFFARR
jgi:Protein of unknown function (DUF5818)